jgi:hypothetical protein
VYTNALKYAHFKRFATETSITLLSNIDIFQSLDVLIGYGLERPPLEEQHFGTYEVSGSVGGDLGSK